VYVASLARRPPGSCKFDCGVPELNTYLKQFAWKNHKKRTARAFCYYADEENATILGYYTLSAAQIKLEDIPENSIGSLPNPVPVTRLGRLAVELSQQGQGIGKELLFHAMKTALDASYIVGSYGLIVEPKTDMNVEKFYRKYDFQPLNTLTSILFLPMTLIEQAFSGAK
jgi:predicted N-acetyltransferase YhbS